MTLPETVACATGCELDELAALTARLKTLRQQILDSSDRVA
jgi:hypothetical protein